jgi:hypothetical protein
LDEGSYCTGNAEIRCVDLPLATTDLIAIALEGFHEIVTVGARSRAAL